jgi:hypothetical protein
MSRRWDSHSLIGRGRTKGTAKFLALLLIVTAGSAPFFASWHEAIVQHVRCAEHGELTHVNSFHVHSSSRGGASSSLQSEDNSDPSDEHQHCDLAFVVKAATYAPVVQSAVRYTPPTVPNRPVDCSAVLPGRACVLASAPKTSPPLV